MNYLKQVAAITNEDPKLTEWSEGYFQASLDIRTHGATLLRYYDRAPIMWREGYIARLKLTNGRTHAE